MNKNLRLRLILEAIQSDSVIDVNQIADRCQVTPKTIRLDLEELESAGLLSRIHGGAIRPHYQREVSSPETRTHHLTQKKAIAKKALSFIKENEVILLDSGSTTLELAKLLGNFNVVVITSDIYIINDLVFKDKVTLFVAGGYTQRVNDNISICGEDTIEFIRKYHPTKSFISASAVDTDEGTSVYFYGLGQTKRAFIDNAETVYCLLDSSKFGKFGFTKVADISELQNIITDRDISEEDAEKIRAKGVNLIYA